MATNRSLDTIAKEILKRENKGIITNVIGIGGLLAEAEAQCEHGEYMEWLRDNFEWSHQTSLRYRRVFELTQNQHRVDFGALNISSSALYYVSELTAGQHRNPDVLEIRLKARAAILKAAKKQRVSLVVAKDIFKSIENPPGPDDHLPPTPPDETSEQELLQLSPEQDNPLPKSGDSVPQPFQTSLHAMMTMHAKTSDDDWLREIETSGGSVKFYRLVDHMIAVRNKVEASSGPIKAKADRAEAKAQSDA
jgi:hypothetical protein